MNTMNQDHVITKKKIKSLQELVDLRSETQEENEELKMTLTKYQDKRKELENRLNQVERENTSLQAQITDYESKVQILLSELENANIQQKSLQSTLIEQKQLLKKLAEERTMHEVTLSEKQTQIQDLKICVDELNKMNEELKYEHDDLQMQLIQAHQEITNYHMKEDMPNMSSSSGCVDDLEVEGEVLEEEPASSHQSTAHSTPVKQTSIHNEIKEMLEESLHLPSPLSDKELQESILARSFSSGAESWTTEDLIDLEVASFMPANGDNDIKTLDGVKLVEKFKEQQDTFTQQINEVISAVEANPDRGGYSRQLFTDSDGEDQDLSPNGMSNDENDQPERRFQRLMLVLQKLQGENERLKRLHDEAVESVSNWEMTADSTLDNRLTVLRDVLLEERALKKQYQREVQSLRSVVNETRRQLKDKEELTQQLQQQEVDLVAQMTLLKKTNLDLAEKCHKSELRASDLQDDILQSTLSFEREKQRNNDLEETLAGTKLARQLDLRDIWRLVQKDVETEFMDDQKDSPLSSSTDLLKEQISKEIETLKDKLVKRQVALGALKGKPMKLKLDSSGNYCEHMDTSPSSPLVDALTIDFFNGNYPTTRPNKRASTLSALNQYSSLDRDSCAVCQKNSNAPSHHTLSCPSLHQRHCYHDPESHNNFYTNLNTSSSSSTSGVDVSPRCSRSVDGQNRRRDFIRSSIRYGSGSQTSAESNANSDSSYHRQHKYSRSVGDRMHKKETVHVRVQSPAGFRRPSFTNAIENRKDANDNNVSQFTRSRSLSFQAAIERGRRSPVDEVDFLSTSPDSTPDRPEYPQYVQQDMASASSRNDGKSVSFHLSTEEYFDSCSELPRPRPGSKSARKLSTLIEEESDLSEALSDKMGTPKLIKRIVDEYATPTKNRFCAQMSESDNFVSFDHTRDYDKSSTPKPGRQRLKSKETKPEREAKKTRKLVKLNGDFCADYKDLSADIVLMEER
ncbi:paramyosin-like [Haliotis rubra]|uniref:paramyosin-like n=1 Tax=Haliotis rubra TaxID=36100 RepID=UPI001EE537B1|nr:paramyosin-like [Haliotis rubra]